MLFVLFAINKQLENTTLKAVVFFSTEYIQWMVLGFSSFLFTEKLKHGNPETAPYECRNKTQGFAEIATIYFLSVHI